MAIVYTYEKYLESRDSLSFEAAMSIYSQISEAADLADADFQELWQDVVHAAVTYANTRAKWNLKSQEDRLEENENSSRTIQHNAVISCLKTINNYLERLGKNTQWFSDLGHPEVDRKRFGDFACYIALVYGVNAR